MEQILKKMIGVYYLIYLLLIISAIVGYFCIKNGWTIQDKETISAISTIGIALMLVFVPLSFKLYSNRTKKLQLLTNEIQLASISKEVYVRLFLIAIPLIYNVFMYFITSNTSLIYCAGMLALVLVYVKPSKRIFEIDLNIKNEEDL